MCLCKRLSGGSWNVLLQLSHCLCQWGHCEVEMALDPPLEGKQCSHQFDKFWHVQGVRILCIKFITSELDLLLLRKLITLKEIYYRQHSNSQGHWGLSKGFLLLVLLVLVVWVWFFFSEDITL